MTVLIRVVADLALYAVALSAVLVWLRAPRAEKLPFALAAAIAAAVVGVLVKVLGQVWVDPRPFVVDHTTPVIAHVPDNGFPSDHTALAMAIALVVLAWNRRVGAALVALAALLGVARVAAGVHHVPDILGALLVAAVAAGVGVSAGPWTATWVRRRRLSAAHATE